MTKNININDSDKRVINDVIPTPTVRRLVLYHKFLIDFEKAGHKYASASAIAEQLQFVPILVRKDLASTGCVGRPKLGFPIGELISAIEEQLGWNRKWNAIVIGVGSLGKALLGYKGFNDRGFDIIAGFDIDKSLHNFTIQTKPIYALEFLNDFINKNEVQIAILAVPAYSAQEIANLLIKYGIKAIWNFAPIQLETPSDVVVQYENLAASLAVLVNKIRN